MTNVAPTMGIDDGQEPTVAQTVHETLAEYTAAAKLGGSQKNRDKITASGKMLVRDRLAYLFDGGDYIEDGLLTRFSEGLPGDAVVCAYGNVDGRQVCVIANDYSVKAGTWGFRTFEKITFAQDTATAAGIPIVYLFDSAGARIDEQLDSFAGEHLLQPGADLGPRAPGVRSVRPVPRRFGLRPCSLRHDDHGARTRHRLPRLSPSGRDGYG